MDRHFFHPERVRWCLNLRVVRLLLRWVTQSSPQGVRLERILLFYGEKGRLSWRERVVFFPIYMIIEILRIMLRWKKEYLQKEVFGSRNVRRVTINLARSVALYGATRPQIFAGPLLVVWNFTNRCNLRCRHCYQNAGREIGELNLKERLQIIEELDVNFVPALAFSGGEPLMDPDFFPVAERAASKEIYVSVATNGTLLTEEMCKKLKDNGVQYVEVSLESSSPGYHDHFRGIPGLFQKTVQGVENALKAGLLVGLAPTVTRDNLKDLRNLYQLAQELRVHRFYAFNFIPTGRGQRIWEQDLSPEEREEMLEILYDCLMEKKIAVFSTSPQFGRKCLEKNSQGLVITGHYSVSEGTLARVGAEYVGGCGAGRAYCAVQPDGTVTPCVFMPIPVGKLNQESFEKIWKESPVMQELRDRKLYKPHCGICEYRSVCGGCRARAYAYFSDYLGPDPGCKLNQNFWEEYWRTKGQSFYSTGVAV
ncbi:MAG: radical SAM protein [Candidatus Caldatribacteriaceae bacterium]